MFIKLTRLDNSPIWLNASFIVTVEPRRLGGATVVPIGDGLDYDVRETPERVLELLAGAPQPLVVPVPTSDALTPTPEDVSPESEPIVPHAEEPVAKPARKTTRTRKTKKAEVEAVEGSAASEGPKAAKKPRATRRTKKAEVAADASADQESAAAEPPPAVAPVVEPAADEPTFESTARVTLSDEQVERLRRMAPGSVRKLSNTLFAQFRVADTTAEIRALADCGVLSLDRDHVVWAH